MVPNKVFHTFSPVYNIESKILVLGTMPSIKSREVGFYYGHPKNRFWKVLESIFDEKIVDKKEFILNHHLALYDVLASCEIEGSSDTKIKNETPNDLTEILKSSSISLIITNGKMAHKYYQKYFSNLEILEINLPSTSPANCKIKDEDLIISYKVIKDYLDKN